MGRHLIWAVVLMFVLGACTEETADTSTTTSPATAATTTTPANPTTTSSPLATGQGRLAIVDTGGNIVVLDPDGSNRLEITENAGRGTLYTQPIWSPDATSLAWGQATGSGFAVGVATPGEDSSTSVIPTGNLPFYLYWSPNGRNLGALHNGSTGVAFQMIDVEAGSNTHIDEDTPFYFSWNPRGDRVVTHAGVSRAETITPGGDRVALAPTDGTFLAPQWTDAGAFHVAGNRLVLENETGVRIPVAVVSGLSMFVANSAGTHVALQMTGNGSPITASTEEFPTVVSDAVVVIDVATGDIERVASDLALGFFWSPDGRSLLVLTTSRNRVVPVVWSSGSDLRELAPYLPSAMMLRDTFPFFPQYAQSVSFWAPDSSAFVYAGAVQGESGIWVQPIDADRPARVGDGVWAVWSSGGS